MNYYGNQFYKYFIINNSQKGWQYTVHALHPQYKQMVNVQDDYDVSDVA